MPTGATGATDADTLSAFNATGPFPESAPEFALDDLVMSGFLGIDPNLDSAEPSAATCLEGSRYVNRDTTNNVIDSSSIGALNYQSAANHSKLAEAATGQLSPTSCIESPISNEGIEALAESRYVFQIGNPPTVSGPGIPSQRNMAPLASKNTQNVHPRKEMTSGAAPQRNAFTTAMVAAGSNRLTASISASASGNAVIAPHANKSAEAICMDQYLLPSLSSYSNYSQSTGKAREAVRPESGDVGLFLRNALRQDLPGRASGNEATDGLQEGLGNQCAQAEEMNAVGGAPSALAGSAPSTEQPTITNGSFFNVAGAIPYNILGNDGRGGSMGTSLTVPAIEDPSQGLSFLDMFRSEPMPPMQEPHHQLPALVASNAGLLNFRKKKINVGGASGTKMGQMEKKWNGTTPSAGKVIAKGHALVKEPGTMIYRTVEPRTATASIIERARAQGNVIPPRAAEIPGATAVQPSKFCHICLRRAGRVTLLACVKAIEGSCRKVVCEKCFDTFAWDWQQAIQPQSNWSCTHCREMCPQRAQCHIYKRTNSRRHNALVARREKEDATGTSGGGLEAHGLQ